MSPTPSRRSSGRLLSFALLALATTSLASPSPSRTHPFERRATPTPIAEVPSPQHLSDEAVSNLIHAMAAAASASASANAVRKTKRALDDTVDLNDLMARDVGDTVIEERAVDSGCLDSSATDVEINSLFFYGGEGATVLLCPKAIINLKNPVYFTAANQVLATKGNSQGSNRATLVVTGSDQSTAIYGACNECDSITVRNIQVNGQRPELGRLEKGAALLEMGGTTTGQTVHQVKAWEPRGWSVLHAIEGTGLACDKMTITNNQIGPAGNPPNTGTQFKRDTTYTPGQWADGISLACKNSEVAHNFITDTTDGGIVIFGAWGSHIHHNIVTANTRQALGGINAVDFGPFGGPYTGTVVEDNLVNASGAFVKVGLAIGGMVWGSDNRTASRTSGGTFRRNSFLSGTGYFGHAIAVAGHNDANIYSNTATVAKFGGEPSVACIPNPMIPTPQAFVFDKFTTTGSVLQNNFVDVPLVFLICAQPGPIVATGPVSALTSEMIGNNAALKQDNAAPTSSSKASKATTSKASKATTSSKSKSKTTSKRKTTSKTKAASSTAKANLVVAAKVAKTTAKVAKTTTKKAFNALKTGVVPIAAPQKTKLARRSIISDDDEDVPLARETPKFDKRNPFELLERTVRER